MAIEGLSAAPRRGASGWVAAIAAAAVLAIAGALHPELRWLHYLGKPLATLLVAAMVLVSPSDSARYRRCVLAGLLLSTLGDVFLMLPTGAGAPDWFTFGLGSFLGAHVAYLIGLTGRARLFAAVWPFALYALIAASVLGLLWGHLPGPLRIPVLAYVVVLAAMAAQTATVWWRRRDSACVFGAIGGAFFVVSDATLAIDRFAAPLPYAVVIVLVTYWIAQTLIGLSVRSR